MNNKNGSLAIGMAVLFEIIVTTSAIGSIISGQWKNLGLSLLAVVCLPIPFIIAGIAAKKKILLPSSFQYVILVFIFLAQYFGEIRRFYFKFWWWDLLLHAIFGGYMVIVGLHAADDIITKKDGITKDRFAFFRVVFAFCLAITLGTLWEVFEFAGDYLEKSHMVKGGFEDTMTNLIVKLLTALVTSVVFYQKLKKQP